MPRSRLLTLLPIFLVLMLLAACGGTAAEPAVPANEAAVVAPQPQAEEKAGEITEGVPPMTEDTGEAAPQDSEIAPQAPSGLRTFTIVPEESSAAYLVDEEFFEDALAKLGIGPGQVDVVGITPNVNGQIQFDLGTGSLGETVITADLSALTTDQNQRDRWLQENGSGPQFSRFPQATFVAEGAEGLPASVNEGETVTFTLNGQLTVRESTAPVSFDVTAVVNGDTLTGTAETRLRLTDLGITPPNFARTLSVADEFGIRVELTARES